MPLATKKNHLPQNQVPEPRNHYPYVSLLLGNHVPGWAGEETVWSSPTSPNAEEVGSFDECDLVLLPPNKPWLASRLGKLKPWLHVVRFPSWSEVPWWTRLTFVVEHWTKTSTSFWDHIIGLQKPGEGAFTGSIVFFKSKSAISFRRWLFYSCEGGDVGWWLKRRWWLTSKMDSEAILTPPLF